MAARGIQNTMCHRYPSQLAICMVVISLLSSLALSLCREKHPTLRIISLGDRRPEDRHFRVEVGLNAIFEAKNSTLTIVVV